MKKEVRKPTQEGVVSPSQGLKVLDSAHLHLRPLWWGNFGVIHLDLSFWHLV